MVRSVRISLATKCQLLFGAAVILILSAALGVVWHRMQLLVDEGQQEIARQLASAWVDDKIQLGAFLQPVERIEPPTELGEGMTLSLIDKEDFDLAVVHDPTLDSVIEIFQMRPERQDDFRRKRDLHGQAYYRYVRAIRKSDMAHIQGGVAAGFKPTLEAPGFADPLEKILLIQLHAQLPARQLMLNRVYLIAGGLLACLLAIGTFWFITTKLILSPLRVLRETAEQVGRGDLNIRAEVTTGDEFQQLADVFNDMLTTLKKNTDQLQGINKSLDLKLGELAETNVALYEANKIKGEFLANVSHELRTPLNSIVGFAEVLEETLIDRTGPVDEKRKRYIANIILSSRRLLDLINDLLDLAKIEAGRIEINPSPMSVADTLEGLLNLLRPQASKRDIELVLRVTPNIPIVQTDASKYQQIVFNLLANAIKFTPERGRVTLAAAVMNHPNSPADEPMLRVSIQDTGPGIPPEDQQRVFDKFTQLDPSVTKTHGGTGLGLTISKELADLLQGQIEIESEPGHGATFILWTPMAINTDTGNAPLMPSHRP